LLVLSGSHVSPVSIAPLPHASSQSLPDVLVQPGASPEPPAPRVCVAGPPAAPPIPPAGFDGPPPVPPVPPLGFDGPPPVPPVPPVGFDGPPPVTPVGFDGPPPVPPLGFDGPPPVPPVGFKGGAMLPPVGRAKLPAIAIMPAAPRPAELIVAALGAAGAPALTLIMVAAIIPERACTSDRHLARAAALSCRRKQGSLLSLVDRASRASIHSRT
jgi:hypothetical protein